MTTNIRINLDRLLSRLDALAAINPLPPRGSCRLALTDEDKAGRDMLAGWLRDADLEVRIDRVGNIFGIMPGDSDSLAPVMSGSHIDTVATGGHYDGALGVLAALETVETLKEAGLRPRRPIVVAAFTNEEGARFAPDMLGSLAYVGGLSIEDARATRGIDGASFGAELDRIGYAGAMDLGAIRPAAFVELHIEQGPVLDAEGIAIGAVENLQGISWREITIEGQANHAGTTPMTMRRDAGHAAAEIAVFVRQLTNDIGGGQVATVGRVELSPNLINVVPERAVLTVDLRNPVESRLQEAERKLEAFLETLAARERVLVTQRMLARFEPVTFDARIVELIEAGADAFGLEHRRMTSGAGHDAQMMARICPTAMIFVPSIRGISHNPEEDTAPSDIEAGANVLLRTLLTLANDGDNR